MRRQEEHVQTGTISSGICCNGHPRSSMTTTVRHAPDQRVYRAHQRTSRDELIRDCSERVRTRAATACDGELYPMRIPPMRLASPSLWALPATTYGGCLIGRCELRLPSAGRDGRRLTTTARRTRAPCNGILRCGGCARVRLRWLWTVFVDGIQGVGSSRSTSRGGCVILPCLSEGAARSRNHP